MSRCGSGFDGSSGGVGVVGVGDGGGTDDGAQEAGGARAV